MKKLAIALLFSSAAFANYPAQVSVLLDVGAKTVIVHNSGTGGSDVTMTFAPGAGERVRFTISPVHIKPVAADTYSTCAAPCTVNVNRNYGQQYYWVEYVDSAGDPLSPRKVSEAAPAYRSSCAGLGTVPQVEFSTVTAAPMPMPIEAIGQDCYVTRNQFPLDSGHASTSLRFYIRIYNPDYHNYGKPDGKFSFQLGSATYLNLTNAAATAIDEQRYYSGQGNGDGPSPNTIGTFPPVREFTLPVVDGTIGSGDTTVVLGSRFNGTDGITSGGRLLSVNLIEADKTCSSTVSVTSNVATFTCNSHGYSNGQTVLIQNAPGIYARFNGLRVVSNVATNTFTIVPCGTSTTTTCTSPNGSYAAPTNYRTGTIFPSLDQPVIKVARCIIPASAFTAAAAPSGAGSGNATNGETTFTTRGLRAPLNEYINDTMSVACNDCHTKTGKDIKYYNYSNQVLYVRTIAHGLSDQNALDVIASIRGLSITVPTLARPWNPPYQPCPGISAGNINDWAAGGGIDCVLTYPDDIKEYMDADGHWGGSERMDSRDMPLPWQMPDWNRGWLPQIHPADGYPALNYFSTTAYTTYTNCLASVTPGNYASFRDCPSSNQWFQNFYTSQATVDIGQPNRSSVIGSGNVGANVYPAIYPILMDAYNHLMVRVQWEFMVEYGTQQFLSERMVSNHGASTHPDGYVPWGRWDQVFFNVATHKTLMTVNYFMNGSFAAGDYQSNDWYFMMPLLSASGNGWGGANDPIDYSYTNAFCYTSMRFRPSAYACLYAALNYTQGTWEHPDPYPTGATGGGDFSAIAPNKMLSYDMRFSMAWLDATQRAEYWNHVVDQFLDFTGHYSTAKWQASIGAGGNAGTWAEDCATTTPDIAFNGYNAFCAGVRLALPLWNAFGVDSGKLASVVTWAKAVWPAWGTGFDTDLAYGVQGDIANGATGNLVTPQPVDGNVVTFTTCPATVGDSSMPYLIKGANGVTEMLHHVPSFGTCVAGNSGTMKFNNTVSITSPLVVTYGCSRTLNPEPNSFAQAGLWWRCRNSIP